MYFLNLKFDRVIFCLFLEVDVDYYERYLDFFFPLEGETKQKERSETAEGHGQPEPSETEKKTFNEKSEHEDSQQVVKDESQPSGNYEESVDSQTAQVGQDVKDGGDSNNEGDESEPAKKAKLKKDMSISSHLKSTTID